MEGGGGSWGHGPRGTSPEAPGAAGCARPGAPLGVAVGDGHCLIWMQAGSSCRGIALVLLLFLCCSFSLASTTWTHAPGTATALWMLHLQPAPQPELLPSRDEHSAPANSHPARGRCVARGWWLKTVRAHHPPPCFWPLCPLVQAALTVQPCCGGCPAPGRCKQSLPGAPGQPCPPPAPRPVAPHSGSVPCGLGPDSPLGGMLRTRLGVCSSVTCPVQSDFSSLCISPSLPRSAVSG